jgi:hypothetical protein
VHHPHATADSAPKKVDPPGGRWEQVPDIPLVRDTTAAFVHELPEGYISNVADASNYIPVQVLTPAGALDRDNQLCVVREITEVVPLAANDPSCVLRTWGRSALLLHKIDSNTSSAS